MDYFVVIEVGGYAVGVKPQISRPKIKIKVVISRNSVRIHERTKWSIGEERTLPTCRYIAGAIFYQVPVFKMICNLPLQICPEFNVHRNSTLQCKTPRFLSARQLWPLPIC